MPTYKYQCAVCGAQRIEVMTFGEHDAFVPGLHEGSLPCEGDWRQVFDFQFRRSMMEHFNHSLGEYVTNESAAQSALSRQSDEMSARMGFTHQFELVDPSDPKAAGVTDEGLEATERRAHEDGKVASTFIST